MGNFKVKKAKISYEGLPRRQTISKDLCSISIGIPEPGINTINFHKYICQNYGNEK